MLCDMKRTLLLSATLSLISLAPVLAQGLSQSDILDGQLRPGWQTEKGNHITALHLRLAPEWKTYWRAPGDAGIPPSFDWSGSENLRSVRFHWPTPEVFHTNGMQTVGYHDELMLPIEVTAVDASRPVQLRAAIELGVCKDICVPASLHLEAELLPPGKPDKAIAAALRTQPQAARQAGLNGLSCAVEPIDDGLRLTARMDLKPLGGQEVVVVEPGLPGVWVSEAEVSRNGKTLTAQVEMVPPSGAPFALVRDNILITVIGPDRKAVEVRGCPAG